MLNIRSLFPIRKPAPVPSEPAASPVDAAIDTFLDALLTGEYVDYAAAYDAVTLARQHGYTRPVQLWSAYHNAIAWSV